MSRRDHASQAQAVYDASTPRYVDFVGTEISEATEGPFEHSLLAAFADILTAGANHVVADVGCGPGRIAALLARHGLDVLGVDVSLAMVSTARSAHPGLAFGVGRLDELPIAAGALGGVVSWYSIIHTPRDQLHRAFAEIARVLDAGGFVLLGFHSGGGELHRTDAHGTGLPLTSYRHELRDVTRHLEEAGVEIRIATERPPQLDHETCPQAFVLGRRS